MRNTIVAATIAACLLAAMAGASACAFIQASSVYRLNADDNEYRYRTSTVVDAAMDKRFEHIPSND
ncbi:MAG: hypothetical protein J5804_02760 [Eggerthellaceae bacterium]|nr:hypothetical protein [Eggerthellaceae bacterium]